MGEIMKIFWNDDQIIKYLTQKGYVVLRNDEMRERAERMRNERTKKVKEKIRQAIKEMQAKGEEITPYRVSKQAGVNYRTVKKYLEEIWTEGKK